MILVDTNIFIAAIRAADPSQIIALLHLHDGAVCGVARAELLHGTRSDADRRHALGMLNALTQISIADAIWDEVGDNLRKLRANGVIVPFPDVVLATVAMTHGIEIWTRDKHFLMIQGVLPTLRLFTEPP